mgnify:CR=1 FL=1
MAESQTTVSVEVLPLTHSIEAGESFYVAVIFSMEPDWHTYWQNPGESGMSTTFTWELPDGLQIISQREPVPNRHEEDGIITFIHEKEAIYLFKIQALKQLADTLAISLKVEWLECRELCRPGSAELGFILTSGVSEQEDSDSWQKLIQRAEQQFPLPSSEFVKSISLKSNHLKVQLMQKLDRGSKIERVEFFPFNEMIYDISTPVAVKSRFGKSSLSIPLLKNRAKDPDQLKGILVRYLSTSTGPERISSIINRPIQP